MDAGRGRHSRRANTRQSGRGKEDECLLKQSRRSAR